MNKLKLVIFIFMFIIIFCFVGVFFVQANEEIVNEEDTLEVQNEITKSINVYGYTFDNPNVIINPYKNNSNSALIMFETDEYTGINVLVNNEEIYKTNEERRHYIGVYNLVYGINNITLVYGKNKKEIEINIEETVTSTLLESGILLSDNHLLVPTEKYTKDNIYTGIREVDAFGKIYYEYILEDGYKGIACEIDAEKLAILSNKLIILDRQNGEIFTSYDISNYDYNWIGMNYIDNMIILYSDEGNISIDNNGDLSEYVGDYNKEYLSGNINYKNTLGIRFYKKLETKKSDENIWLLNYNSDIPYKIDIKKEFNRIIISSKDINNCNTYIILDKLFDKRVYELCNNTNYIYTNDFEGKYSVYFKIDNDVYKTDKYLEF